MPTLNRIPVLVSAALAFFFVACLDSESGDPSCPETEWACTPQGDRNGFFPMVSGNSWTFRDDAGLDSGGSVETFTMTVTGWEEGARYSDGTGPQGVWWDITLTPPPGGTRFYEWLSPRYWQRGDSVYARQPALDGFVSALSYVVPAGADTVAWSSTYGGDVAITVSAVRIPDSVTVPAGTFAPCVAHAFTASESHRTIICEGVGWVSFEVGNRNIQLTAYQLQE